MTRASALHRLAVVSAVSAAMVIAACSSPDPGGVVVQTTQGQPDLSGTTPTATSSDSIAALRAAADLAPCPTGASDPSGASDLPAIELACLAGGPDVSFAGLVGKPFVVNFWASDCGPCKDEGPYLQSVYEAAGDEVGVLGVNFLDPYGDEGALAGAREFGMRFPILFDPDGELGEAFRVPALPATFFVDADGTIVGEPHFGAFESADDLKDAIGRELGVHL